MTHLLLQFYLFIWSRNIHWNRATICSEEIEMKMYFIVYKIETTTPQRTDVVYCGRSEKAAEYYMYKCPVACGVYMQLPVSYFNN